MCGICGIVSSDGAPDLDGRGADERDARSTAAPTTRASSTAARWRWRPAASRSSTSTDGHQPIANEDGSVDRRPERRDLQLPRAASASSRAAATASRTDCDTEVLVHLYEEHGDALRRAPARDVRDRALGRAASGGCCWPATASGSSRSTTATPTATLSFASELKALLEQPGLLARDRPAGARRLPRLQLDPGAADDLRRGAASCRPATCSPGAAARSSCAATAPSRARSPPSAPRRARRRSWPSELREVLRDSVRAHLVADVPVGVLLSRRRRLRRRSRRCAARRVGASR